MSSLTETFVILIHYALASPVVFLFFCLFMHFCLIKKKKRIEDFLEKEKDTGVQIFKDIFSLVFGKDFNTTVENN